MIVTEIQVKSLVFSPNVDEIIRENFLNKVNTALALLFEQIIQRAPVGVTGDYVSGLYIEQATQIQVVTIEGAIKMQGTAVNYHDVIEFGRKAGGKYPPHGCLITWMMYKFNMDYEEAKRKEFALASKIAETGIEGQHTVQLSVDSLESYFSELFSDIGV